MMRSLYVPFLVSLSLFLLGVVGWRATTQAPSPRPITVGLVDMKRVVENYRALQEDDARYREIAARFERMIAVRELLEPHEWEELAQLEVKEERGKLSKAERKRLEELRQLTGQRRGEMEQLRLKRKRTAEERKRLLHLQELQRLNRAKLKELMQKLQAKLAEINRRLTQMHANRIRNAAKRVAQNQNLRLVIVADPDFVLYAEPELDITDQVLSILNKGK